MHELTRFRLTQIRSQTRPLSAFAKATARQAADTEGFILAFYPGINPGATLYVAPSGARGGRVDVVWRFVRYYFIGRISRS
jgi:hypothetical protein